MSNKGWSRSFDDPIPLPNGGELRSLRDAGNYIAKLPKREHDAPAWRAAIQALMLVVERDGNTMLPRIGIMRALYPGGTAPTPREKRSKKYRVVSRYGRRPRLVPHRLSDLPAAPWCAPAGR
jgi:hypothetical protein